MNNEICDIPRENIRKLLVADRRAVWRDTRKNFPWIISIFLIIASIIILSSFFATKIDRGFVWNEVIVDAKCIKDSMISLVECTEPKQNIVTLELSSAIYFTVVNMTTVGFGDIFPITQAARLLSIFNAIFGLITFAGLVSIIMLAFSPSSQEFSLIDEVGNFSENKISSDNDIINNRLIFIEEKIEKLSKDIFESKGGMDRVIHEDIENFSNRFRKVYAELDNLEENLKVINMAVEVIKMESMENLDERFEKLNDFINRLAHEAKELGVRADKIRFMLMLKHKPDYNFVLSALGVNKKRKLTKVRPLFREKI